MPSHHFHPRFLLDEETLHFFSVLGRALFTAQHLELNCRELVKYTRMMESRTEASSDKVDKPFLEQVEELWKKPLGSHIEFLKKSFFEFGDNLSDTEKGIASLLCGAKNARNEIAHISGIDIEKGMESEFLVKIEQLRPLIRKIAAADKYVSMLLTFINQLRMPSLPFLNEYEDLIEEWVTCPTFKD